MGGLEARRRGVRDWVVDGCLFAGALTYCALWALVLRDDPATPDGALLVEVVLTVVGCALLWFRRRWPLALALVLLPLSTYSILADGAMLVALFTLAVHRRPLPSLVVGGVGVLGTAGFMLALWPHDGNTAFVLALTAVGTAGVVGWGFFVRHRRQLILSLRERASRAEAEAELRAERAQREAREDLAREMHDVLGHRLSLLSVHAGALEYRRSMSTEDVTRTAGVLRATAHQALQDLREVIGILRAPVGELPQPTFADGAALVEESRQAGMTVRSRTDVTGPVPDGLGRTAYRIVQEGLTNARRHAPGAQVRVTVAGGAGDGLTVEVDNTAPTATVDVTPGSGRGLAGLTERVALVGGRLYHGPDTAGGFSLHAWLPWPP
ncbi:MAG: sensor histidine kinase [Streptosporangiales bacterium]|nr:sensor histidine kinase [Streptosporangiales bacterium]